MYAVDSFQLTKLASPSEKWAIPPSATILFHDDGEETFCILGVGLRDYLGRATCGARDVFDRELGQQIALGRACKKYWQREARRAARNGQQQSHPV